MTDLRACQRAAAILQLDPATGYEVYRVGRIFTAELWGVSFLCPACGEPIRKGERARDFYTRQVGTAWVGKIMHVVHEVCFLKAGTASGLKAILYRKTLEAVQHDQDHRGAFLVPDPPDDDGGVTG